MDLTQEHRYTMQQKLSFTLLVIFGILIVVLGFLQMRNTIYTPFVIRASDLEDPASSALFQNDQVKLQSIDTDHDGLNDYEELNFYTTSPYLPDTDSDGIDDKMEISNRTDPICPEGQRCSSAASEPPTTTPSFVPVGAQNGIGADPGEAAPAQILEDISKISKDPQTMRALMIRSGAVTKEELDQVDDATILKMAQELMIQKFGTPIPTTTPTLTTSSP